MTRVCFTGEDRLVYITPFGERYNLHAPPWRAVLSEEGFGTPPMEYVADRAPFQHGDTVRSFYLQPRAIQILVIHNFKSRAEYWAGRELLLNTIRPPSVMRPPPTGSLLYYQAGRRKRQLDVLLESGPGFVPPESGWREWTFIETLRFVAHDPTWYDPLDRSQVLLYGQPQLNLIFPITFPIVFDQSAGIQSIIIYQGTWVEYPTIDIVGPVTGFTITNQVTGDKIGLTQPVPADYTVTVHLRGIKTITGSDGVNWLNRITDDTDLATFSLVPDPGAPGGVNQMILGGTGTNAQSQVVFHWNSRYFGI